jgi:LCP family protein required for cell wall assembly
VRLVCLLPVRNGQLDLPGYFESVRRFADAVVALDDGSEDSTQEMLAAEPLVRVLLTNPRRAGYVAWDDSANRNRLLAAAAELEPEWVISLDGDERIDAGDAAALQAFLEEDALPGLAYSFRVYRMIGDLSHYDESEPLWVCRLFAYEPDQRFPDTRLHLAAVPTSIARRRWIRTTLRIQHLAGLSEERRIARFQKYAEADPDNEFQKDYAHLLSQPLDLRKWEARPHDLQVLFDAPAPVAGRSEDDFDAPVLSAIVISRDDGSSIERTVRSVVEQKCHEPFEVIVVTSGKGGAAQFVRENFPEVQLLELSKDGVLPGVARNAGLRVARGDYVSFPGSHIELPAGSLAARIRAHNLGYAMVTGTTLNGTPTTAGWANYFLDHGTVLPGRPSEELIGPPAHCSYRREALLEAGGFPEDMRAGEDTVVNRHLWQLGYVAYRARDVHLIHYSRCRTIRRLVRHHFQRGRASGKILLEEYGRVRPVRRHLRWLLGYVPRRVSSTTESVRHWGGHLGEFYRRAYPLVVLACAAAWLGIWTVLLRPRPRRLRLLPGHSDSVLVIGGLDRRPGEHGGRTDLLLLVRFEHLEHRIRVVPVVRDLLVDVPGCGPRRINEAYDLGATRDPSNPGAGPGLLRETIRQVFGIHVDDHAIVDFWGFRRVVDAIGGVEIEIEQEIHDETTHPSTHFYPGRQRLDGKRALQYAVTRKTDSETKRRDRQLQLLFALKREVGQIRSPLRAARVVSSARAAVDTSLSRWRLVRIALTTLRLPSSSVVVERLDPPLVRSEWSVSQARWFSVADPGSLSRFVTQSLGIDSDH